MAKKKYKSNHDGPVTIVKGEGRGVLPLDPGGTYETDDPVEQAALDANPDVSAVKAEAAKKR